MTDFNNLRKALDLNPADNDLRGVLVDFLQENEDETYKIHQWFYENKVRPFVLHNRYILLGDTYIHSPFSLPKSFIEPIQEANFFPYYSDFDNNTSNKDYFRVLFKAWQKSIKETPLLVRKEPIFTNTKLPLYQDLVGNYAYSASNLEVIPDTLAAFTTIQKDKNSPLLVTECKVDKYFIPSLDCDNEYGFNLLKNIIDANGIPHAVFESSPGHYWIILDMPTISFHTIFIILEKLPGVDQKYMKITRHRNKFILRAEPKEVLPRLISSNIETKITKYFLEIFLAHWQDPYITELSKIRTYKSKKYI